MSTRISKSPLFTAVGLALLVATPAFAFDQKSLDAPELMPQVQSAAPLAPVQEQEQNLLLPNASQPAARSLVPAPQSFSSVSQALKIGIDRLKSGDKAAAVDALGYAANEGSATARFKLGQMYAAGDGVPHDDGQAFQFFLKITQENADVAPDARDARVVSRAFIQVGKYFLEGVPAADIAPDANEAYRNFHYAAAYFGDPDAQYNIAQMHLDGALGDKDPMQAARWLKLAADKRHKAARGLLGHMLFFGNGIQRQPATGLAWLELANKAADGEHDNWIRESFRAADEAATPAERELASKLAVQISGR
jgi:uncharacterized protein